MAVGVNGRSLPLRDSMRQTFRATLGLWLVRVIAPVAAGGVVVFWAAHSGTLTQSLFLAVPAALFALWSTIRLVQSWIEIDGDAIHVYLPGQSYRVPWRQVTAAALSVSARVPPLLRLVTKDRIYTFPLGMFALNKIWRLVQGYVSPLALEPRAVERALAHPGAIAPYVDLHGGSDMSQHTRVRTPQSVEIGESMIFLGIVILLATLGEWRGGVGLWGGLFLLMVGLLLPMLCSGTLRMDAQEVSYRDRRREQTMRWDTLIRIEMSADGRVLTFYGRDKSLGRDEWCEIWGPPLWRGRGRKRCAAFLEAQAHRLDIPIRLLKGSRPGPGSQQDGITEGDLRREEDRRRGQDGKLPGY